MRYSYVFPFIRVVLVSHSFSLSLSLLSSLLLSFSLFHYLSFVCILCVKSFAQYINVYVIVSKAFQFWFDGLRCVNWSRFSGLVGTQFLISIGYLLFAIIEFFMFVNVYVEWTRCDCIFRVLGLCMGFWSPSHRMHNGIDSWTIPTKRLNQSANATETSSWYLFINYNRKTVAVKCFFSFLFNCLTSLLLLSSSYRTIWYSSCCSFVF